VTKARSASDLLGHPASGRALGHPTGFLWTALRRLANHDGSAVGHVLGRSAGKAAPRRIALLG
jgi:hypothetical protein